ncbi:MAG: T9SS type A sorting domain-containing protein [Melioribacteraceae bacterium]|nr:T9SS type A sorting domain-containing protein [Melioribacteraceae bacterium]
MNAQINTHTINITANTSTDTTLKRLSGIISGPIQPYESLAPDLTERFQEIGVFSVRNNDYHNDMLGIERIFECPDTSVYPSWNGDPYDTSNYHWEGSDSLFQSIIDGGFEPFLRLGGEYRNIAKPHDFIGPQNPLQENNWIIAAIHEMERYSNWKGDKGIIEYLDIWTEFPGDHFWTRTNASFYSFWARAFDSLKTNFPQYKIGGPGFLSDNMVDEKSGLPVEDFLVKLYSLGLKPDWLGWHLWNNNPEAFYNVAQSYHNLLSGTGSFSHVPWAGSDYISNVEVICDAYGMSIYEVDSFGNLSDISRTARDKIYNKKEGAALLTGYWIALQYADIERSYYYRSGDVSSDPNADPEVLGSNLGGSGLFHGDTFATYKPKAHSFRLCSSLENNYPHLLSTNFPSLASDSSKLWVLGAKNNEDKYAVIISNTSSELIPFNINLLGEEVSLDNFPNTNIYTVNNSKDGLTPYEWKGEALSIFPGDVQLITLEKNTTGIDEQGAIKNFVVEQNFPNPFNPSTNISFTIPEAGVVKLNIYNVLGEVVSELVSENLEAGFHQYQFNASTNSEAASNLTSGIYFYSISVNGFTEVKKMNLIK